MPAARAVRPVAMLTHSYYEEDPRVRREAEALVAAGRPVDVFALRRPGDPAEGTLDGVVVRRLDVQRHQGAGIVTYLAEYLAFFVRAGLALVRAQPRRRYALVQVHTLPDFLALAALPLRLAGVPVLLDLHESMPEFFRERFRRASNPFTYGLLRVQERLSLAAATAAVTVNESLRRRLVELGVPERKVFLVPNSPALARFDPAAHPRRIFREDGSFRLVYAGALSPTYEIDVLLEAVARLAGRRPDLDVRLDLYGRDYGEVPLATAVEQLGIADRVTFHGRIPIEAVPGAIAGADVGVGPTRRNAFTDYSLSTKLFEYAAMGKPVVASRLPMVERTFPAGTIVTYEPGDADDLARQVEAVADDAAGRAARVERTAELVARHAWEVEAPRYVGLVERLAAKRLSSPS